MFSADSWALPTAKILEKPDVRRILDRAKELCQRDYVFFATAVNTGLRLSEVLHIDKDDIRGGTLTVVRRKKKILKPSSIDIAPALVPVLEDWAGRVESGWIFPGHSAPCFIRRRSGTVEQVCVGGHMSKREIQRRWLVLLRELGIYVEGRGIHSTRHYAITAFYEKFRDLRATQMFAAHSSSSMTERYAHCVDMKEKIVAMDSVV